MSANTSIEWTDSSWNPIRARDRKTGKVGHYCELISPGCAHCYASAFQRRFGLPMYAGSGQREGRLDDLELFLDEKVLAEPLRWKKPRRIFVCSMTDLFGAWVPDEWIDRCFATMALTPQHTHQVLTKRPERMQSYLSREYGPNGYPGQNNWCEDAPRALCKISAEAQRVRRKLYGDPYLPCYSWPLPNVWLGTSCEDQPRADERIPHLLRTPAAVRFLSVEPLLSAVDLTRLNNGGGETFNALTAEVTMPRGHKFRASDAEPISWVIVGGESGHGARQCDLEWIRSIRDQCRAAGVAFFCKQLGSYPTDEMAMETVPGWNKKLSPEEAKSPEGLHVLGSMLNAAVVRLDDRKGGDMAEWSPDLRVREFPEVR